MGTITIKLEGSFDQFDKGKLQTQASFMAISHGHEYAVRNAIRFLEKEILPSAIKNDDKCAQQNVYPDKGLRRHFPSALGR